MRIKLLHVRWCLGLFLVIIANIHLSLWVQKVHEKAVGVGVSHPYSNTYQTGETRLKNGSDLWALNDCTERARKSIDDYSNFNKKINQLEHIIASHSSSEGILDKDLKSKLRAHNSYIPPEHLSPALSHLPSFATDESEYVISSLIERSSLSSQLYLTTFMLSHHILEPNVAILMVKNVHPVMMETWKRVVSKFRKAKYLPSGARRQQTADEEFFCEIKHSPESKPYIVPGDFLPNRLTSDSHANRQLDVLRCPMKDSREAYEQFARGDSAIIVNILRGNTSLATFTIPWKTRRTGYLMSSSKASSRLDSWKGHELTLKGVNSNSRAVDKLHMCVTTTNEAPSKENLPLFVEFISHHLLIGASHISLPVPYPWNSPSMNQITEIFQTYIQEGRQGPFYFYINLSFSP